MPSPSDFFATFQENPKPIFPLWHDYEWDEESESIALISIREGEPHEGQFVVEYFSTEDLLNAEEIPELQTMYISDEDSTLYETPVTKKEYRAMENRLDNLAFEKTFRQVKGAVDPDIDLSY